jgi:hypothetical protein
MERASRRTRIVRLVCLLALAGGVSPGWGSPGDVLQTDVPVLGGDPPKSRDLQDGDASVSTQTGAFQHSFPLSLPPGRLVEPTLALSYSSSAAIHGSSVGSGWSLSLPEIRRDPSQSWLASQAPGYAPRFVSSMAGGNRLVSVSEPAACDVLQTYRAQFDGSYARYERLRISCSNLLVSGAWRVRTTDGLTHYFGEAEHMGGSNDPTWAPLTRTVDPFGNTATYTYLPVEDLLGNVVEHVISRIEYTTNPTLGVSAHAQVLFDYTTPPSCSPVVMGELPVGARLEARNGEVRWLGSRRLDRVRTQVRSGSSWREVRTVALSYDSAADDCGLDHGPIRLLTSIQESATSPTGVSTSMPPVTFSYGPLRPTPRVDQSFSGSSLPLAQGLRAPAGSSWPLLQVMLLDFDGDGRLDRLVSDPDASGCAFQWQRNTGNAFSTQPGKVRLPTFHWGDGSGTLPDEDCSLAGQRSFYTNWHVDPPECPGHAGHYLSYRFLDVNGDGLPDLVTGLQIYKAYIDPDPADPCDEPGETECIPQPIPDDWGWDPDECPEGGSSATSSGGCPSLPPGLLRAAEVCDAHSSCRLGLDVAQDMVRNAPHVACGDLMADGTAELDDPPGTETGGCPPPRGHLARCEGADKEYLWLVYWNRGGGVLDDDPTPNFNPIPLESNAFDTGLGGRPGGFSSSLHAVMDIDGDGLIDILTRVSAVDNNAFVVFRGTGNGSFVPASLGVPYLWLAPTHAQTGRSGSSWVPDTPLSDEGTGFVSGYAGVMDASGDGLPDLLFRPNIVDAPLASFVNLGDRFRFSDEVDGPGNPTWPFAQLTYSVTSNAHSSNDGTTITYGNRAGWLSPLDFDADGRLDLYWRVDPQGDGDNGNDVGRLFAGDGAGDITDYAALDDIDRDGVRQYLDAFTPEFRIERDYIDLNGCQAGGADGRGWQTAHHQ